MRIEIDILYILFTFKKFANCDLTPAQQRFFIIRRKLHRHSKKKHIENYTKN